MSNEDFFRLRFDEKIDVLKNYLPESLSSRAKIYGIISKGIHELSEEECKEMFPLIKTGIELILDEIIVKKAREEKEKTLDSFLSKKSAELKKK
jgi:hypothetical protein